MEDLTRNALKQLATSSYYKVAYEEYIVPEMRKLVILDKTLDLSIPDYDFKIDILARQKAFDVLEEIFDNINRLDVPDIHTNEVDSMI